MDAQETRLRALVGIALVLLVALPYLPSLRYGFVYDDHGLIAENTYLGDASHIGDLLTLKTLRDPHVVDGRRPVLLLSYFLDGALWNLAPWGCHVTSLLLHLVTVFLAYLLLLRLSSSIRWSFISALLWGVHPALTEAVHAPGFRADILCSLFALVCMLAAARPRPLLAVALPALALALGSKEGAASVPILLAWLWICFPQSCPARTRMAIVLAAMMVLVMAFVAFCFTGRSMQAATGLWNGVSFQWPDNFVTMPWIWARHLGLLVWPHPLCADYVIAPVQSLADLRFAGGVVALSLAVVLALGLVKRLPFIAFGLGWMLISFAPVSNVVPLFNPFAERYVYFISLGLSFVLVACSGLRARSVINPVVILLYLFFAVMTWSRLQTWKDDKTLWTATLRPEPRSARAHTWLGILAKQTSDIDEARRHFEEADRLNPQDVSALINLAILQGQGGDLTGAEATLREAVRRRADKADAHWNLAMALKLQGKDNEAMEEINATLHLDPNHPQASTLLAPLSSSP